MLISIETHITCDFPGGRSGPPIPPQDPHMTLVRLCVCAGSSESSPFAYEMSTRLSFAGPFKSVYQLSSMTRCLLLCEVPSSTVILCV